jgi:hypothetical protein
MDSFGHRRRRSVAKAGAGDAGLFVPFAFPQKDDDRPLLALNPRGTRVAISWEGADSVQVIDARTGRAVRSFTGLDYVHGVAFLSATVLLVTTDKGCVRFDLARSGRKVLLSESGLGSINAGPNGRIVALGVERGLVLYDTRKGQVLHRLKTDLADRTSDPVMGRRAAFSAGGRYVAALLTEGYYRAYLVVIWEVRTGRRQRVFDALAHALAFRDDTLSLAVADDWGYLKVYEPDQGEEPAVEFKYKEVDYLARAMRFQAGGRTLEILLDKGSVIRVVARTGRVQGQTEPPARDGLYRAVASADWSVFAAATQDGIVVWPSDRAEPGAAPGPPRYPRLRGRERARPRPSLGGHARVTSKSPELTPKPTRRGRSLSASIGGAADRPLPDVRFGQHQERAGAGGGEQAPVQGAGRGEPGKGQGRRRRADDPPPPGRCSCGCA